MFEILDVLLLLVIIFCIFNGWRQGLIIAVFNVVGYIFSIYVARIFAPKITEYLLTNTEISVYIESILSGFMGDINALDLGTGIISGFASNTILNLIAFGVVFAVSSIIISTIKKLLRGINRIPVIGKLNRIGGAVVGVGNAILIAFIVLAFTYFIATTTDNKELSKTIENTILIDILYENNPIVTLIKNNIPTPKV